MMDRVRFSNLGVSHIQALLSTPNDVMIHLKKKYDVVPGQKLQISLTVQEIHIFHIGYPQQADHHSGPSIQPSQLSDQGGMLIDTVYKVHF